MERNSKIKERLFKQTAVIFISAVFCVSAGCEKKASTPQYRAFSASESISILKADSDINSSVSFLGDELCVIEKDDKGSIIPPVDSELGKDEHIIALKLSDNELLYQQGVYDKIYPASLTKILTGYIILRDMDLSKTVSVPEEGTKLPDSYAKKLGLSEGDQITVDMLLKAALITSANDAAKTLAIIHSGSEEAFCDEMNATAKALGATHSHFSNSHGLHADDHYTTLYDIYLIFNEILKDSRYIEIAGNGSYTIEYMDKNGSGIKKDILSTNKYITGSAKPLDFFTVLGGKTGTTNEAGSCMIVSAKDINGVPYIVGITKAEDSNILYTDFEIVFKMMANQENFIQ
ncbi:MAG: hypothetical protein K5858_05875 [Lachnospiraceae bacterium]|nr:hypothetical protein [Lachnospiraceae bacterium]